MKTLVAGGAGFIGSNFSEALLGKGHEVICLDNLITGRLKNIKPFRKKESFQFKKKDVTKPLDLSQDLDVIFHFASPAPPKFYQRYPIETLKANIKGTKNLLEIAKKRNIPLIFASSSEVYGLAEEIPTPESYYGYVNSFGPRSCYDEGKRAAEAYCYSYIKEHRVDVRILRIFNTYGPKMRPDDGRVISNFIVQALNNESITVYGSGKQTRSFCYINDLVDAILKVSKEPEMKGEVINLGNPNEMKIIKLAKIIKDLINTDSEIVHKESPEDDPSRRCPDISKAKKLLGWEPTVELKTGVRKTTEYFKDLILK